MTAQEAMLEIWGLLCPDCGPEDHGGILAAVKRNAKAGGWIVDYTRRDGSDEHFGPFPDFPSTDKFVEWAQGVGFDGQFLMTELTNPQELRSSFRGKS